MNARTNIRELDRIRTDIGAALRIKQDAADTAKPASQNLTFLLGVLEAHARDAERERLFAEVDARINELIRVAGREPQALKGTE
jgi:hypothetical protein